MDDLGDPRTVTVGAIPDGTVFRYDYDFGDGWEHDVRVEGRRTAEEPTCLAGARACPPEDSGGPHGYARLLQILADPRHPEHADVRAWLVHPRSTLRPSTPLRQRAACGPAGPGRVVRIIETSDYV